MARFLNQLIIGFAWGFVAFVHFAVITVVAYKVLLDCVPQPWLNGFTVCDPSKHTVFYVLAGITGFAAVALPIGFGLYWALKKRN